MSWEPNRKLGVMSIALILGLASQSWAGSPPPLRFDPFRAQPEKVDSSESEGNRNDRSSFVPVLLSTIVGGERPLANLSGEILAVDEESHGYRLLEVRSFEATFLKNGEPIRLEVATGERKSR